ncbi:MAG: hypothetical protein WDZ80_03870 [Candidatus Paceibacterota bacterium]
MFIITKKSLKIALILAVLFLFPMVTLAQSSVSGDLINTEGIPDISSDQDVSDVMNILKEVGLKVWDLSKQLLTVVDSWLENNFNISLIDLAMELFNVIVGIVTALIDLIKGLIPNGAN